MTNDKVVPGERSFAALDNLKRDRFELLSAYLDGEVTALEKRQVEQWLATDQQVRYMYSRLCKLRAGMQSMPAPVASQADVEASVEAIYGKANRRPKVILAVVGTAIAVVASSLLPASPLRIQFANFLKTAPEIPTESLDINLNTPILEPGNSELTTPSKDNAKPNSVGFDSKLNGVHQLVLPLDASVINIPNTETEGAAVPAVVQN